MNRDEQLRFARQLILPEVGGKGQQRLLNARVLVVGAGGLGCPATLALAGAGIGHITIADPDTIEMTNLHRQLAYTEEDLGRPKADVLAREAERRGCRQVLAIRERLDSSHLTPLLREVDLVLDGSDNFETRFAVADACVRGQRPLVYGAITGFSAHLFLQPAGGEPCLRCLFEAPPTDAMSCADAGVLPGATTMVGGLMAQAAIGIILKSWSLPWGSLQVGELRQFRWRQIDLQPRSDCQCTSEPT